VRFRFGAARQRVLYCILARSEEEWGGIPWARRGGHVVHTDFSLPTVPRVGPNTENA
jgi:hypothetical protein